MANSSAEMKAKAHKSAKKFEKIKNMGVGKYDISAMEKCEVSDKSCSKKKRK